MDQKKIYFYLDRLLWKIALPDKTMNIHNQQRTHNICTYMCVYVHIWERNLSKLFFHFFFLATCKPENIPKKKKKMITKVKT